MLVISKRPASELVPHLLASLGYVHNIAFGHASSLNVVAWSLEIEVQFYLVAPLLASVFAIRNKGIRRALIIFAAAMIMILQKAFPPAISTLFGVLQYFLVGFLITDTYLTDWKNCRSRCGLWDTISAVAWLSIIGLQWDGSNRSFLLPAAIFFAYAGVFRGRLLNQLFCNRWLVTVGGMCYTIYLYHSFIISLLGRGLHRYSFTTIYWVYFLCLLTH